MLPWIIGGAVALGVCAWLSSCENEARQALEDTQYRAKTRLNAMSREMKNARTTADDSVRFQKYIALYGASVELSKSQYRDYETYKKLVKTIRARKNEIRQKIGELKAQRSTIKGKARQMVCDELAVCYVWLDEIKVELTRLYDKKSELLEILRQTNQNTHELKTAIRDRCGHGGRVWYERKQVKIL